MLKSSKRLITLALSLLILFTGCNRNNIVVAPSENNEQNQIVEYKPMGKEVSSPIKIPYVIDNPIEIVQINVSENVDHQRHYFQISGLLDKEVEDNINHAIKELFEQMESYASGEKLPPYRGIETAIHEDKKIHDSVISVIPQFNSNNVLSVTANVAGNYYRSSDQYIFFSATEALNFDLTTGKLFSIEDVFTNDVDGLKIVNDAIINELNRTRFFSDTYYDPYLHFNLVAPFKGVNHDQKFYLSNSGICIIIDYNNPEFGVGFFPNTVTIPFYSPDQNIGITERFYDKSSTIYTKVPNTKRFLADHPYNRAVNRDSFVKNDIQWFISTGWPKDLPKPLIEEINQLQATQEQMVTLMEQKLPITFVEQDIYADRIASYINIRSHMHFGDENEGFWQAMSYVYMDNGEQMDLTDIFVEDFDYLTLLKKAIDRTNNELGRTEDPNIELVLDDIMFTISDTFISFIKKEDEWLPNQGPFFFNITYEEIGFENLKIFDQ